jgi:brefeldin A-inhibited guanine nucleotide-exchange protein
VILTSIYLNNDCDFDAVNLYKTIIHHLTSLAVRGRTIQKAPTNKAKPVSESFSLSVAGLEVLVVILQGFLKALNLAGGDDTFDEGRSKVRGSLQLDVGMAVKEADDTLRKNNSLKDDIAVTAQDIENMENDGEDAAGKIVDAFDKKRAAQQQFELGIIKFKLSAKKGLLFFIQNGLLHMDAKEIADFFYEHKEELDKTQIGEIFGGDPLAGFVKGEGVDPEKGGVGFYIRVLHHYVDGLEFAGLEFADAIRLFLSGFRLPGESQKVDRIMEKFAERFTLQNEHIFPSADTAFILAFAVIMCQTDLHNPNIKPEKKMNEESFVKMNKGISVDGGDLPSDFLIDLFRSIKARPFTLKEDEDARKFQKKDDDDGFNDIFFANA